MVYKDSSLQRMTKAELIELLRCTEHNLAAAEEKIAQQVENVKDWEPVTRCQYCIYAYRVDGPREEYACRKPTPLSGYVQPEHFCGYGEPKTNLLTPAKWSSLKDGDVCLK